MIEPKVTAADIRKAMLARWQGQEWAIMWEVTPATGAQAKTRYADAVMMSLWPSRGLELHGVEIKVSRSDWKREAADPAKAEMVGAFCDRWWVHVAPNVIHDLSEVPPAWGVRVFDGKVWKTLREAEKTTAKPVDRGFLASLLRRADGDRRREVEQAANEMIRDQREAIQKRIDDGVKHQLGGVASARDRLQAQMDEFEAATGLTLGGFGGLSNAKEIGRLVKWAMKTGVASKYGGIASFHSHLSRVFKELDDAMRLLDLPQDEEQAA